MSKVLSVRVDDGLAEWVDAYAKERGKARQEVLLAAVRCFREDCRGGVPELGPVEATAAKASRVRAVRPQVAPRSVLRDAKSEYQRMMRERQVRLNKGRS